MRSNVVDEQSEARKLMLAQMEQKQPERWASGKWRILLSFFMGSVLFCRMRCFG